MAVFRRPGRSRPIRLFLIGMIAVPLVSLAALYAFSVALTVPNAIKDHNYNTSSSAETTAAVTSLSVDLPQERAYTYIWLASGGKSSKASLLATRAAVSKALPSAEASFQVGQEVLSASSRARQDAFLANLRQISAIRAKVDAGGLTPAAAFSAYSGILDSQFAYYAASTVDRGGSGTLGVTAVGALDAYYSLEMAGRESALVGGTFAAGQSTMTPAVHELFISSAASRKQLFGETTSLLTGNLLSGYASFARSTTYKQFVTMESGIADSDGPMPVNPGTYQSVSAAYLGQMAKIQEANGVRLTAASASSSSTLLTEAILAGGVGLAAVAVSVFLMLWFGRRVTSDLTALYGSVREMADVRLPRVVAALRRGDDVDVLAESPPPGDSSIQEISQIAQSFGTVQEEAVAAAVEQARLRKGVNQVFLNISMRNQSLLHRQLGMLDTMERGTSDPGALADLFRLDHLTTRMRRHAEGLIILSGSTPGRGWREPVPVVDVLRAAVAEVEDYVRVDVVSESRDLIAGNAVNDVIHLVAELVENAAVFSPPNTRIEVRADRAGTGLVAEIEDRGLGLSGEELADINRRLASPPEFDLANSEQLGLFVVSRLAVRHAIKVSLRQSVYGGTTAILVLPFGVVVREEEAGSPVPAAGWPAEGRPDGAAVSVSGDEFSDAGPVSSLFGVTGRHRLAAAATGRRTDSGTGPAVRGGEPGQPSGPRPLPRAPWEMAEPEGPGQQPREPGQPQAAPDPSGGRPPWEVEATRPWPDAFSRPAVQWEARPAADPAAKQPTQGPRTASSGSHLGMPIRVPQASLAPQLTGRGDRGQQSAGAAGPEIDERPPEATRSMLDLMQQGWARGRADNLDGPADAPDNGHNR